jgi:hypothetical protein
MADALRESQPADADADADGRPAFATLGHVVATGAEVESTTGKRRVGKPRAWAPSDHRNPLEVRPARSPT